MNTNKFRILIVVGLIATSSSSLAMIIPASTESIEDYLPFETDICVSLYKHIHPPGMDLQSKIRTLELCDLLDQYKRLIKEKDPSQNLSEPISE